MSSVQIKFLTIFKLVFECWIDWLLHVIICLFFYYIDLLLLVVIIIIIIIIIIISIIYWLIDWFASCKGKQMRIVAVCVARFQ